MTSSFSLFTACSHALHAPLSAQGYIVFPAPESQRKSKGNKIGALPRLSLSRSPPTFQSSAHRRGTAQTGRSPITDLTSLHCTPKPEALDQLLGCQQHVLNTYTLHL